MQLYFINSSSQDATDSGNFFEDSSGSTPHNAISTTSDDLQINASQTVSSGYINCGALTNYGTMSGTVSTSMVSSFTNYAGITGGSYSGIACTCNGSSAYISGGSFSSVLTLQSGASFGGTATASNGMSVDSSSYVTGGTISNGCDCCGTISGGDFTGGTVHIESGGTMSGGSVGQLGTTNSITFQVDGTVSGGYLYPATYEIGSGATISGGTWGNYAGAAGYGPDLSGMTTPPTGGTFTCLVKLNSAIGWCWSYSLAGLCLVTISLMV